MTVAIVGRNLGHQHDHANALEAGLSSMGIGSRRFHTAMGLKPQTAACWGWRIGKTLRDAGADVLVMERGYLGDRFKWTSLGWNGLNGYASFPEIPDDGGERFNTYFPGLMKPWRTNGGDYVLLIGQVPGDASLKGQDLRPWYAKTAQQAQMRYEIPVVFRPHPLAARRGGVYVVPGTRMQHGSLAEALSKAAVVVSFNSNTTVESVLAGVPTVCMDRGSMAFDMCSHEVQAPLVTPDREQWAHQLAHRQFLLSEIRSGAALKLLFSRHERTEAA